MSVNSIDERLLVLLFKVVDLPLGRSDKGFPGPQIEEHTRLALAYKTRVRCSKGGKQMSTGPRSSIRMHLGAFFSASLCLLSSSSMASDLRCAAASSARRTSRSLRDSSGGGAMTLVRGSSSAG